MRIHLKILFVLVILVLIIFIHFLQAPAHDCLRCVRSGRYDISHFYIIIFLRLTV